MIFFVSASSILYSNFESILTYQKTTSRKIDYNAAVWSSTPKKNQIVQHTLCIDALDASHADCHWRSWLLLGHELAFQLRRFVELQGLGEGQPGLTETCGETCGRRRDVDESRRCLGHLDKPWFLARHLRGTWDILGPHSRWVYDILWLCCVFGSWNCRDVFLQSRNLKTANCSLIDYDSRKDHQTSCTQICRPCSLGTFVVFLLMWPIDRSWLMGVYGNMNLLSMRTISAFWSLWIWHFY